MFTTVNQGCSLVHHTGTSMLKLLRKCAITAPVNCGEHRNISAQELPLEHLEQRNRGFDQSGARDVPVFTTVNQGCSVLLVVSTGASRRSVQSLLWLTCEHHLQKKKHGNISAQELPLITAAACFARINPPLF